MTWYTGAYCLVGNTCWVCEICCALHRTTLPGSVSWAPLLWACFCFVCLNALMFFPPYNITGLCSAATTAGAVVVT
jgi:hypothetical protein